MQISFKIIELQIMTGITKEPKISVGILSAEQINFELHGDFKASGSKINFSGIFTAVLEDEKIICKSDSGQNEFSKEIIFEPQDIKNESFLLKDVVIGENFHWERREKERFTGSLKLIKDKGKITAINIIPVERYLLSVISSEMSARSQLQLLKAHSIVSRSWLLAQMEKAKSLKKEKTNYQTSQNKADEYIKWYGREDHELFDVCADDHCQRYHGTTRVFTEVARQAVKQTTGIVLVSNNKMS